MGKRGPKAKPSVKVPAAPVNGVCPEPWNQPHLGRGEKVVAFIESLLITKGLGAGEPFLLRQWQKDIIYRIYDRRADVRTALITMPRKNGKTALAAALCLAHLVGPETEARGEVYSAAADRDQAAIIFREMVAMLDASPELAARVNIQHFAKRIEDEQTGTIYQALSSDARKAHGLSASFVCYDELAQAQNRHLYDNLVTATGGRAEPLTVVISTQSSDPHHIMSELVNYGEKVLEGVLTDTTFLPILYTAPIDADPWDEQTWFDCNPALGDFRSLQEMRGFADQAKRIPAREAVFRSLYLNQRVDADQRFLPSSDWDACGGYVEPEKLRGCQCWAGLDLSSTRDLTALVLYFPYEGGAVLPYFWVPGDNLADREDRDRVPYRTWARKGLIEAPAGRAIDKQAIVNRLAEISNMFDIQGIAYDRWGMGELKKLLDTEGIELPLVDWGQGYRDMGPAVSALEAAVLDRKLKHPVNPVLTWNMSNVVIAVDPAGSRKIAKDKAIEKVDGAVALAMALGLHARTPEQEEFDFERPLVLSA